METRRITNQEVTRECALCGFVTTESIVVCPDDGSALVTRRPDPLIGATLVGRFDIESLIGAGGMGNVYKAKQRIVEREVAVKILHSEKLQRKDAVLRFQQEARAAAALSHRNIVGLFDFGLTEDNVPFIVMDYIAGVPLSETLKTETLSVQRFIQIFGQVCDALQHAHSRGIIHRDIKPSNIMLVQAPGQADTVKILDFGIAKLLPGSNTPDGLAVTQTGELFGSPQYMSPEQFAGKKLDARSDMYSLGCVMYEALTGQPPVQAESLILLVQKHANERPAAFKSVKPDLDVPQQLEAVIFKTLEKDPEARFPSMSALKHNLEFVPRFAEEERSHLPDQKRTAAKVPSPAVRTTVIACAVVFAIVGGFIAFLLFGVNPPSDQSLSNAWSRLQLQVAEVMDPRNRKRQLALMERLRDRCARDGNQLEALKYANDSIVLSRELNGPDWHTAGDLLRRGQIEEQFHLKTADASFAGAAQMLEALAQSNRKRQKWGDNLSVGQPVDGALVEMDTRLYGANSAEQIMDLAAMADDMRAQKSLRAAEEIYQRILPLQEKLSPQQQEKLAAYLVSFAEAGAAEGNVEAESYYKAAINVATKSQGDRSKTVAELTRTLGLYYKGHGQIVLAESTLMDALAIAQAVEGEHGELVTTLYDDLGEVYRAEREFDKATEMFKLSARLKQL